MKSLNLVFSVLVLSLLCPRVMAGGACENINTSEVSILKTYTLPIRLGDPVGDAEKRFYHGDYRLLSVNEFTVQYPGLKNEGDFLFLEAVGERNIQGTSDALESDQHAELVVEFSKYAFKYNVKMLELLKGKCKPIPKNKKIKE